MADGIRVREEVHAGGPWSETLLWYARAVEHMQERPMADPTRTVRAAAANAARPNDLDMTTPLAAPLIPPVVDRPAMWVHVGERARERTISSTDDDSSRLELSLRPYWQLANFRAAGPAV